MEEKELERYREWLLKERDRLKSELKYVESTMDQTQSEWVEDEMYQNHPADVATETYMRESDLSLARNARDTLGKVEAALKRIDEGTYGLCVVCGRPIERERLEALPYVELCMEDQEKLERSW